MVFIHKVAMSMSKHQSSIHEQRAFFVEIKASLELEIIFSFILKHIERAGVHSGDSMAVYPPQTLSKKIQETIADYTKRLAIGLNCIGMMNIQFVIKDETVYVIEVNPRASRTVPFLSKVTDIPMAQVATNLILGQSFAEQC